MTRLVVTAIADGDAANILSYLAQEAGLSVTEDYSRRIRRSIERLVQIPESGAPRPGLGADARIAIVAPSPLYDYSRRDDTVRVLRILHGKRNISADLLKP
jgi:plasmid stabilization system protein ParE